MKKSFAVACLIILLLGSLLAERIAVLNGVLKPDSLAIDNENLFVVEGAGIWVYGLRDGKLKFRFGKKGEGPAEFIPRVTVFPREKTLLVTSRNKISWFSRTGEFIRAEKPANFYDIFPLGDHYAARGSAIEGNLHFITVNILDAKLNIIKELARMQSLGQRGDKISPRLTTQVSEFTDYLAFF